MRKRFLVLAMVSLIGMMPISTASAETTQNGYEYEVVKTDKDCVFELDSFQDIEVNYGETPDTPDTSNSALWKYKMLNTYCNLQPIGKFTIKDTSFVKIIANHSVIDYSYDDKEVWIGTSPADAFKIFGDDHANSVGYDVALEAGTYYIYANTKSQYTSYSCAGSFGVTVNASTIDRTGVNDGSTLKNAIEVTNGEMAVGAITGVTKDDNYRVGKRVTQQWFKMTVDADSDLDISTVIKRYGEFDETMGANVKLYNEDESLVGEWKSETGSNTLNISKEDLEDGVYYAKVTYPRFCKINFTGSWTPTEKSDNNTSESKENGVFTVKWNKVNNAVKYKVYRGSKYLGVTKGTTMNVKSGKLGMYKGQKSSFKIKALNKKNKTIKTITKSVIAK